MKLKFSLLFLFLCGLEARAQWISPGGLAEYTFREADTALRYRLKADAFAGIFSNAAGMWLPAGIIQGHLERDAIDRSFSSDKPSKTHWGFESQNTASLMIRHTFKKNTISAWYLDIADRTLVEAAMSREFASLVLRGNADITGESIETNPLLFRSFRYQRIGAGLMMKDKDETSNLRGYLGMSLVRGGNHLALDFQNASLYTSDQADTLQLAGVGTFTGRNAEEWHHGLGLALNAGLEVLRDRSFTQLRISDLGALRYGSEHNTFDWDTSLIYTGVEWNRSRRTLSLPEYFGDSFAQSSSTAQYESKPWVALPCDLSIRSGFNTTNYQVFWASLRVRLSQAFVPEIRLGHSLALLKRHLNWSNELGFGGYRSFFWDTDIHYNVGSRIELGLRMHSVQALVLPQATGGFGAAVRGAWTFGRS